MCNCWVEIGLAITGGPFKLVAINRIIMPHMATEKGRELRSLAAQQPTYKKQARSF